MEERKAQITAYLKTYVNPVLQPIIQQIAIQRPPDILLFIQQYIQKRIKKPQSSPNKLIVQQKNDSDSQAEDEGTIQQMQRKFEEMKKKKCQKKISRQGISAQVFGKFNEKKQFKPRVISKNQQTYKQMKQLIHKSILFSNLNKEDQQIIIDAMEERIVSQNELVIKQGDQGNALYIVSEGEFDCFKIINGQQTYLKTYKKGDFFGQLALMYNAPRAASIRSKYQGKIYGLDRQTFTNVVQQSATKRRSSILQSLSKVEILGEIDPYQKEQLCDILKEEEYSEGDYVVREGQDGNKFYIIVEGRLIAQKRQNQASKKVYEYFSGDYFGEIALVRNTVRQASVKAESNCRLLYIERDAFKRILGPVEEILKRNEEKYKKYVSN